MAILATTLGVIGISLDMYSWTQYSSKTYTEYSKDCLWHNSCWNVGLCCTGCPPNYHPYRNSSYLQQHDATELEHDFGQKCMKGVKSYCCSLSNDNDDTWTGSWVYVDEGSRVTCTFRGNDTKGAKIGQCGEISCDLKQYNPNLESLHMVQSDFGIITSSGSSLSELCNRVYIFSSMGHAKKGRIDFFENGTSNHMGIWIKVGLGSPAVN